MKVYFSGISGVGIGPLAELASDAGHQVFGSDVNPGAINDELLAKGVDFKIYSQDGTYLQEVYNRENGLDWFAHTSALPADHPELLLAQKLGIRISKRDEFLAEFIKLHNLKLIAVAGTSGKTTTTGMAIWAMLKTGIPVSYLVGTTLSFGPAGKFNPESPYLVYECDEFDRNFLNFNPHLSLITSLAYDHVEIFPTEQSYYEAFKQFVSQSEHVVGWRDDSRGYYEDASNYTILDYPDPAITLAGAVNRKDATLVLEGLKVIGVGERAKLTDALNNFPGTNRRFERLADNLYSDYAHLPEELKAMLQKAREVADAAGKKVAVVYEPLQNMRQYNIRHQYRDTFTNADKVLWLPTFRILGREDDRPVLSPADLIAEMSDPEKATPAILDEALVDSVKRLLSEDYIVVVASGGKTADSFFRKHFTSTP